MRVLVLTENATLRAVDGAALPREAELELPRIAGQDVHQVGNVALLHPNELELPADARDGTMTLRTPTEEQWLNGFVVMASARDVARRGDRRELGRMIGCFAHVTLRLGEVHEYLGALPRRSAETLIGARCGRGRPRDTAHELGCVYTMDRVREVHRVSRAEAARRLAPLVGLSVERLQNLHAELGRHAHIRARGLFIRALHLTPFEWGQAPTMTVQVHSMEFTRRKAAKKRSEP